MNLKNSSIRLSLRVKRRIVFSLLIFNFAFLILNSSAFALDVKKTVLSNGLTVIYAPRHNLPLVMVTLLIKAGQIDEPEEGLANLTASLLTEGTKKRSAKELSEEIEFIGAGLSATAGSDYITISLSVLKKDIEKGFEVFSDILLNPTFPKKEIKRLKDLIKGSLRQMEEEPSFLLSRAFKKELYKDHPYARLIQGSPSSLDMIGRDDLIKFHSSYFLPNNTIISIVGDIKEDELLSLINKYLGRWKMEAIYHPKHNEPSYSGRKVVKINKALTQANILIGHLGVRRDNPDYYAISVMNHILGGGGFSSRLMQTIRDKMGLAYDVHSYFTLNKEIGAFQVGVQTKNESANTVIDEILKEIKRIREKKVTEEEIESAKSYLIGSFSQRIDTMRKISDFLSVIEFYGLGIDYLDKYPEYIKKVTVDDILQVARKYLNPDEYVLVVVGEQEKAKVKE